MKINSLGKKYLTFVIRAFTMKARYPSAQTLEVALSINLDLNGGQH